MVQVILNLGGSEFSSVTVLRPIIVSIGLVVVVLLGCHLIVKPGTLWFNAQIQSKEKSRLGQLSRATYTAFISHTVILVGFATSASYAGTSNLFAAYLAGASISWWDTGVSQVTVPMSHNETRYLEAIPKKEEGGRTDNIPQSEVQQSTTHGEAGDLIADCTRQSPFVEQSRGTDTVENSSIVSKRYKNSGEAVFRKYYATALQRILKPLFFVSYKPSSGNSRHILTPHRHLSGLRSLSPTCSRAASHGAASSTPY
jgi:hypothetical protein